MKRINIEPVTADDAAILAQWLTSSKDNLYDKDVFFYPATRVLKSSTTDEPIAYLPAQLTLTIDAPAFNPSATKLQIAVSMNKLVRKFARDAFQYGVREINFFTASDEMAEFAVRQGFEEIKHRMFRLKISSEPIEG